MNQDRSKWTDDEIRAVESAEKWAMELDDAALVSEFSQAIIMWTHNREKGDRVRRDEWVKIADVYQAEILARLRAGD